LLPHQTPSLLARVLTDPAQAANFTPGQIDLLIQLGAILSLEELSSPAACAVLVEAAANHAIQIIREQAYSALLRRTQAGDSSSTNALYTLAIEHEHLPARQYIVASGLMPERAPLKSLLDWLLGLDDNRPVDITLTAQAFFEDASPALRSRILAIAARTPRFRAWGRLLENLAAQTPAGYQNLVGIYPTLTEQERAICRQYIYAAAANDLDAREAFCALFIHHDDHIVRDALIQMSWLPAQMDQQALFYFLTGQVAHYQVFDFDHRLLVGAYENADKALRRRLLNYSRQSGQIEWLRTVSQVADTRYLSDLADADWEAAINRLFENERYPDLWRLSHTAPALWSAAILARLAAAHWQPNARAESETFANLARLAQACWQRQLDLRPASTFHSPADDLTCLAFSPKFNLLAGGTSGQHIYLWEIPGGDLRFPALIGPATVTRALAFSPDGEHLVAADGDKRIRIFRHSSGQVIKTIEGHHGLVRAIAIHPAGRIMASAGFDGQIRTWRFPIGSELKRMDTDIRENFCLAILADGETLVSAGLGFNLSLWKLNEGVLLRRIPSGSNGIVQLAAGQSSELFATAGRDRVIAVWNATSGLLVRKFTTPVAAVNGLAFFPGDQMLASASADGSIYLWNVSSPEPIARLSSHNSSIVSMLLAADGETLISADTSGEIKYWNFSALIWTRLPFQPGHQLPMEQLQARVKKSDLSVSEKHWLEFTNALWQWSRRFDIEVSEPVTIRLGEFDIEL
jgi:WD40 repeat protein